jgi:hypothetical protein
VAHATVQLDPDWSTAGQVPADAFGGGANEQADAVHVCAVSVPLVQVVAEPLRTYPELQVYSQLVPEERLAGQVPRFPLGGADTVQGFPLIRFAPTACPFRPLHLLAASLVGVPP